MEEVVRDLQAQLTSTQEELSALLKKQRQLQKPAASQPPSVMCSNLGSLQDVECEEHLRRTQEIEALRILKETKIQLQDKNQELRRKNNELQEEKEKMQKDNEKLQRESEKFQELNETLQEEKEKLHTENEKLQKLQDENQELRRKNHELKDKKEKMQKENEKLQREKEKFQELNETLQEEKEKLHNEKEKLQKLQEKNQELRRKNNELKDKKEKMQKENEKLQREREKFQKLNETLQEEKEKLHNKKEKLQKTQTSWSRKVKGSSKGLKAVNMDKHSSIEEPEDSQDEQHKVLEAQGQNISLLKLFGQTLGNDRQERQESKGTKRDAEEVPTRIFRHFMKQRGEKKEGKFSEWCSRASDPSLPAFSCEEPRSLKAGPVRRRCSPD